MGNARVCYRRGADMSIHHTINAPLSRAPRIRLLEMPAEDSSLDISDVWAEEVDADEGADVTAYFKHTSDDHGEFYADMIGIRVLTATACDLYTAAGAMGWLGYEAIMRIEAFETVRISE